MCWNYRNRKTPAPRDGPYDPTEHDQGTSHGAHNQVSIVAERRSGVRVATEPREPLRKRPEVLAVLALTCTYFAVIGGHSYSIDGLLIYRQALSIVQNFSLQFGTPVFWGHIWPTSISGIGLALLYVPGVLVLTKAGLGVPTPTPGPGDWDLFYRDAVYAIGAAPVQILIAVATAYLVFRLVR